jgi:SAM-dependent methyltransferase
MDLHGKDSEIDFIEKYWTGVWDRAGGPTQKFDRVFRQEEYKFLEKNIIGKDRSNYQVLDGGCGLGQWVLALNSIGLNCTGIDISKKTIGLLQQLFPLAKWVVADIRSTGFPDNHFDLYYSWGVFEHFESGPRECILEARRILKSDGLLFLTVPFDNFRHAFGESAAKKNLSVDARFYQYRFTKLELIRELNIAGFEVIHIKPIHKRQGVLRFLEGALSLPHAWRFSRALAAILAPVCPASIFAHMICVVAKKST